MSRHVMDNGEGLANGYAMPEGVGESFDCEGASSGYGYSSSAEDGGNSLGYGECAASYAEDPEGRGTGISDGDSTGHGKSYFSADGLCDDFDLYLEPLPLFLHFSFSRQVTKATYDSFRLLGEALTAEDFDTTIGMLEMAREF